MATPFTRSAPIASGGTLYFNEESHSYWDSHGNEAYESVTSLINFYTPEFDAKAASERVALRRGLRPDEVLTEWGDKAERARDLGTRVHAHQEALALGRHPTTHPVDDYEAGIFESGAKAILGMKRLGFEVVATEMMSFVTVKFRSHCTGRRDRPRKPDIALRPWTVAHPYRRPNPRFHRPVAHTHRRRTHL